ncbi:MAG: preprotein translocase subunit YajC [Lachnospiraceae bacterium]|nr:preprotein translocase subunit YajC [Lachnospiraceae bacterium]MBO7600279.1 preprotein translocase subunit YajC [Lachnospiraceae bacterium]
MYTNAILDAAAQGSSTASLISMLISFAILGLFFYFMIIKPQKKEQKRTQAMLSNLEVGDAVLTSSGFYGTVIDITDDTVIIEFGNNKNCRIPMQKSAIAQVEKAE